MQQNFKVKLSINPERLEKDASYLSTHFWHLGKFQIKISEVVN